MAEAQRVRLSKRNAIIQSLIKTEKEYLERLDATIKVFVRPLSDIMEPRIRQLLFSNIKEIYCIHTALHSDWEYLANEPLSALLPLFTKHKYDLAIHAEYENGYPKAVEKIDELATSNPQLAKKIQACESSVSGRCKLRDSLRTVLGRLQYYHTSMLDVLRLVDAKSEERPLVEHAIAELDDLLGHTEAVKRDRTMMAVVAELQGNINNLKLPNRQPLVMYGALQYRTDAYFMDLEDSNSKPRHIVLLDRVLIICRIKKDSSLEFDQALSLQPYRISDDSRTVDIKIYSEGSAPVAYTLNMGNKEANRKLCDILRSAQVNLAPPRSADNDHSFVLTTFSKLSECDVCHMFLKGLISQGYMCTKTKKWAHKECLQDAAKVTLPAQVVAERSALLPTLELPEPAVAAEQKRKYFGGYFGRLLLDRPLVRPTSLTLQQAREQLIGTVKQKLVLLKGGLLKGGFRYSNLHLMAGSPTVPQPFIMWETCAKGLFLQDFPKAGFVDALTTHLSTINQEIELHHLETFLHQYKGQMQSYEDSESGELFVTGYYFEISEHDSSASEDELCSSSKLEAQTAAPGMLSSSRTSLKSSDWRDGGAASSRSVKRQPSPMGASLVPGGPIPVQKVRSKPGK